jgi:hypothetical protein
MSEEKKNRLDLSPAEIAYFVELRQAIALVESRFSGSISLILRQRGVADGVWKLAEDCTYIFRDENKG